MSDSSHTPFVRLSSNENNGEWSVEFHNDSSIEEVMKTSRYSLARRIAYEEAVERDVDLIEQGEWVPKIGVRKGDIVIVPTGSYQEAIEVDGEWDLHAEDLDVLDVEREEAEVIDFIHDDLLGEVFILELIDDDAVIMVEAPQLDDDDVVTDEDEEEEEKTATIKKAQDSAGFMQEGDVIDIGDDNLYLVWRFLRDNYFYLVPIETDGASIWPDEDQEGFAKVFGDNDELEIIAQNMKGKLLGKHMDFDEYATHQNM